MSEEGGDLPLVEVQVEVLHCHFPIRIDLVEVIDGHSCNEADEMTIAQVRENFRITEKRRRPLLHVRHYAKKLLTHGPR